MLFRSVCIAVAGWRVWRKDSSGGLLRIWSAQLVLNFLWMPVFFVGHWIGLALITVLLLLVVILTFIAMAWRVERMAAMLFAPYAAWVGFASLLNAAIFLLN